MAAPKLFTRFEDIESDLAANAPSLVYKYRDWNDPYHKLLLTDYQAWFAHPFDLNDPEDLRPEIQFDLTELDDPAYLAKMTATAGMNSKRENRIKAENRLAELRANPGILDANAKEWHSTRENYDQLGVFSTAKHELNDHVWKDYSADHSGFCVGLNTIELCRQVKSGFGQMKYCDAPIIHRFLTKTNDGADILYYKKKKWEIEDEFRFVTVGVGRYSTRVQTFKPETISELILGYNILPEHEQEIIEIVEQKYPKGLKIFKTKRNADNSLAKYQIK
ncbi:MAG: DUF2971 domain-containing protein [Chryseobacterium sp.]|nr:MAG: DUF2971 domain-containing protein [Chryseobacterium sp.]